MSPVLSGGRIAVCCCCGSWATIIESENCIGFGAGAMPAATPAFGQPCKAGGRYELEEQQLELQCEVSANRYNLVVWEGSSAPV